VKIIILLSDLVPKTSLNSLHITFENVLPHFSQQSSVYFLGFLQSLLSSLEKLDGVYCTTFGI